MLVCCLEHKFVATFVSGKHSRKNLDGLVNILVVACKKELQCKHLSPQIPELYDFNVSSVLSFILRERESGSVHYFTL